MIKTTTFGRVILAVLLAVGATRAPVLAIWIGRAIFSSGGAVNTCALSTWQSRRTSSRDSATSAG